MTVQLTSVVHCKKERYDVYIGRPSKWGNPFTHVSDRKTKAAFIVESREEAIRRYEEYLFSSGLIADIEELRGKVLACWCKPQVCHGDVLARLLNMSDKSGANEKEVPSSTFSTDVPSTKTSLICSA